MSKVAAVYTASSQKWLDIPQPIEMVPTQHSNVCQQTTYLIKAANSCPTHTQYHYVGRQCSYLADIVIRDQDIPSSQVAMYEALLG